MLYSDYLGKIVELKPTEGAYQKTISGKVVEETATRVVVRVEGRISAMTFNKKDCKPTFKIDREFPSYRVVLGDAENM